eukprot:355508_1
MSPSASSNKSPVMNATVTTPTMKTIALDFAATNANNTSSKTDADSFVVSSNGSNTITPTIPTKKAASSPRLLDIPAIPSPTAETEEMDENDSEYQKWYSNRKSAHAVTPTTPHETHNTSLPQTPLSISITGKGKARASNYSARNLKLFDVLGIDKTPLSEDNNHKDIPLAYDMAPVQSQTPIGGVFMGILKRASSLIRTDNDAELESPCKMSHPRPRTRSSSDPTDVKMNMNVAQGQKESENKEETDHVPKNRLVLHISQVSNRSEPGVDGDMYRYKATTEYIASSSMMNLSPSSRSGSKDSKEKHLVGERNEHAQSIPNDVLLSVLVGH